MLLPDLNPFQFDFFAFLIVIEYRHNSHPPGLGRFLSDMDETVCDLRSPMKGRTQNSFVRRDNSFHCSKTRRVKSKLCSNQTTEKVCNLREQLQISVFRLTIRIRNKITLCYLTISNIPTECKLGGGGSTQSPLNTRVVSIDRCSVCCFESISIPCSPDSGRTTIRTSQSALVIVTNYEAMETN